MRHEFVSEISFASAQVYVGRDLKSSRTAIVVPRGWLRLDIAHRPFDQHARRPASLPFRDMLDARPERWSDASPESTSCYCSQV